MELIENGFKQTEVGLIPLDWISCEFQDVLTGFSSGMTPYRGTPEFYKGDMPWITSGELNYNIIYDTIEKITKDAIIKTNLKVLPKGTFLMAITGLEAAGTRGSCGITGVEATTNQSCMALYPKDNKIVTEYLYHFYINYGDELAFKFCQGTKQQSYTGKIVKILPINLPPTLKEQKAIATALSDVDALIQSLETLIEKKKAIKQGAMQELLTGKTRLAGFEQAKGFKQTEVGLIPEDWEIIPFIELSTIKGRIGWQGLRKDEFTMVSSDPFLITGMNFKEGEIRWDEVYHVPYDRYQIAKEIQLKEGDVLMTKDGTIGKLLYVSEIPYPRMATLNSHLLLFRPIKKSYVPKYLYYHLHSNYFKSFIDDNKSGSTFFGISQESIGKYKIIIPPYKEQKAIAQTLSAIDQEIQALQTKKEKYQVIKEGMMQELLTGKTRLL